MSIFGPQHCGTTNYTNSIPGVLLFLLEISKSCLMHFGGLKYGFL